MKQALIFLLPLALLANLLWGSVALPAEAVLRVLAGRSTDAATAFIVLESRLPQALTAMAVGAALGVAGQLLQTFFANPLADPSILGINSGAQLGVAVVWMGGGGLLLGSMAWSGFMLTVAAAFVGALAVLAVLLACSAWVGRRVMLLIVGIMVSYLASSVMALLYVSASAQEMRSFFFWGMGSLGNLSRSQLPWLLVLVVPTVAAALLAKPLNALLLGEHYAQNSGVDLRRLRFEVLGLTGFLCAVSTALCGPVAFMGLAVPHLVRWTVRTADHRRLLPLCAATGALVLAVCQLFCRLLPQALPINSVMPLVGVPVVLAVVLRQRRS